jgi:hypothetical protein
VRGYVKPLARHVQMGKFAKNDANPMQLYGNPSSGS